MSSQSDNNINFTPSTGSQGDFGRLRLAYFSNEFPHDNLHHLLRRLWNHSKDRSHPLLATFIAEATLAVREEIRRLPTELKSLLPAFQTIFEFADYPELRRGQLSGSIDGVLLSAVELATFIGYVVETAASHLHLTSRHGVLTVLRQLL
jgi:monodictyphenone polyketide synthase